MLTVERITDRQTWNQGLAQLPYAHILQTWEWGEFKRITTGWQPVRLAFKQDGAVIGMASIGVRSIAKLLKVMYVSKGAALPYEDPALTAEILAHMERFARTHGAIWLKIDPDVIEGTGIPGDDDERSDDTGTAIKTMLTSRGWRFSADQVQFRNTVIIDVTRSEDDLLASMSQNTRRKVRIAERDGVQIRVGSVEDLPTLYDLYRVTGERDHFLIRPPEYYEKAWKTFIESGLAHPLIAEIDGKPIAMVILFHFAHKCWYFYGASSNESRESMPNYLLQWHAIKWAKANGYAEYDLWGAPNTFVETDSMWGVFAFKRGFRGIVTRHIGAWDYAPYPPLYWAYTEIMPRVIARMRRKSASTAESP